MDEHFCVLSGSEVKDTTGSHRDLQRKENPTGRDPWGPGEARRTARGGLERRSRAWSAESSDIS
jgi:hypothetical protein